MNGILSDKARHDWERNGYIRTGINLSEDLISGIAGHYRSLPSSASNWSYFLTRSLSHCNESKWKSMVRVLRAQTIHRRVRKTVYDKSIYGTSPLIKPVVNYCLEAGLTRHLADTPLMVGHDIFLESDGSKKTFGYHEDNFGWEIFFQTEHDITLFIPLHDLSKESGGRLIVESDPGRNDRHQDRNAWIRAFAEKCRSMGALDKQGRVTRNAIMASPHRREIAKEYNRLILLRSQALLHPELEQMSPINMKAGEVILFNNKNFHDVEPWNLPSYRSIYIIRTIPLFDNGIYPSSNFLNNSPCNRSMLLPESSEQIEIDVEIDPLPFKTPVSVSC